MAVDERMRHEMYDVATKQDLAMLANVAKQDLAALATSTTQQFEHMNTRFDELHRLTLWLFSTQIAMVGLVFTIAKLA